MSGAMILLRKELLESWRTLRLPIVAGLFLLVGLTSPLLAKFLPEIVKAAAGDQLTSIPIPTPVAADAVIQTWKNLAQFGAFAAIVLAMGAVATERDRGTAAFVLSKTVSRGAFLAAKVVAIGGDPRPRAPRWRSPSRWIYTAILFEPPSVAGWIALAFLAWLGLVRVGGADLPRQHGDRLDRGGGRDRLRRAARCCRSPPRSRTSGRFLPGGLAGPADRDGDRRAGRRRRTCSTPVDRDGGADRGGRRGRGLVVRSPGALSRTHRPRPVRARTRLQPLAVRRRRARAGPRSRRRRTRARRGSRRCPRRARRRRPDRWPACADSWNGTPTWRMTPQAGCSCSTVIPSATASRRRERRRRCR